MCLITSQEEPIILKTQITVYKHIQRKSEQHIASSLIYEFDYHQNVLYKCEIEETDSRAIYDETVAEKYKISPGIIMLKGIYKHFGKGFHSALKINRIEKYVNSQTELGIFIIPKGSKVYYDETGLIVSNRIIFKKYLIE